MPSERAALETIAVHATEARLLVSGMTAERLRDDKRAFHAVTRCLEIISEASRRLSDGRKARHPNLPWRDMAGAGNVYRHDYDNVAASFVYKTVTQDLAAILEIVAAEMRD